MNNPNKITESIARKITAGAVIWIIISTYQLIVGLASVFWGVSLLGCGIWNLIMSIRTLKYAKVVRNLNSGEEAAYMVKSFDDRKYTIWLFMAINFFFGGFLGVIGGIYDLYIRSYVLKNAEALGVYKNGEDWFYEGKNPVVYNSVEEQGPYIYDSIEEPGPFFFVTDEEPDQSSF